MTLPQRVALIVKRALALIHPCAYGELSASGAEDAIAVGLEREVSLLMPGTDAKALVAAFRVFIRALNGERFNRAEGAAMAVMYAAVVAFAILR